MGLTIKQATWGDEGSATDITPAIQKQADAGYLDLVAGSNLVPAISLSPPTTVNLTDEDKAAAKKWAVEQCGNANDSKCVAERTATAEANSLQRKLAEQSSSANIVTGRRLTVTVIDDTGAERTVRVPDGQKLKYGDPPKIQFPTVSGSLLSAGQTVMIIVTTAIWVFGIAIAYKTFVIVGQEMLGYALTALAAFLGPFGVLVTPIGFLVLNYFKPTNISAAK